MASKRYVRNLSFWWLFMLLLCMTFCYALVVAKWYLTSLLILAGMIATAIGLFRMIDRTNRRLVHFFRQVEAEDHSIRFDERNQGLHFGTLNKELNQLSQRSQNLRNEFERRQVLFSSISDKLSIGIFLLDQGEQLSMANPEALKFLNLRSEKARDQLRKQAPHFFGVLSELRKSNRTWLEISKEGEVQRWLIKRSTISQGDEQYELFLINNLQVEMESRESEVVEKLMHTLTHEIMNSISPVSSLVDTLQMQIEGLEVKDEKVIMDVESHNDLRTAADIINRRSEGLMEFVKRYSMMARLPRLQMEKVDAKKLIEDTQILLKSALEEQGVILDVIFESRKVSFRADKQLLQQVLLNLIKNAAEALEEQEEGKITLTLSKGDGYNYISVMDNGPGVTAENRKQIFLPFFSTKDKGSGIGLSLSRKIIEAHQGRLYLRSHTGFTEFRIELAD